ncbi:hypothetical protein BBJ28_00025835 [Nothophytophthora sp. Chile5]|nr:hypothetical protein BBJ28_00025835 [Nothophytophthora sp. Chile5]
MCLSYFVAPEQEPPLPLLPHPVVIPDDDAPSEAEHDNEHQRDERREPTQLYQYTRVVQWMYDDDGGLYAEVEWENTIEPATNLDPDDLLEAQRLLRRQRRRNRLMALEEIWSYIFTYFAVYYMARFAPQDATVDVVMREVKTHSVERIRLLRLQKNHGKGGAIRKGVMRARGERVLFADADNATEIRDLDKLAQAMDQVGC